MTRRYVGLALSGGGVRAAAFHLGVLRCLAERELLESVRYISTVSGGSLLVGLVFSRNEWCWPESRAFLEHVHPTISSLLQARSLQLRYLLRLFLLPWNWLRFPFRANVLAEAIRGTWGVRGSLDQLPAMPVWAINGTTMETGRRWRFLGEREESSAAYSMGDGEVGYTDGKGFPVAQAMATSAAFPGGISPLRVKASSRAWELPAFHRDRRDATEVVPKYRAYHIADGGVYDNLGLEPIFDVSRGQIRPKSGCRFVIVSDAGAPLRTRSWGPIAQVLGFSTRTVDIMSAQTRNLRVRGLVRWFREQEVAGRRVGHFIGMANSAKGQIERWKTEHADQLVPVVLSQYLPPDDAERVSAYPTTLRSMNRADFERIERHGYELAKLQFALYPATDDDKAGAL